MENDKKVSRGFFLVITPLSRFSCHFRISYSSLLEASFRNKIFSISYRSLNSEGQVVDKRLFLQCHSHRIARYMFRLLTEDHTFFTHEVVNERVRDHIQHSRWQSFCHKYLGCKYDPKYHFDVVRTQHEAYARAWEQLHQLDQEELNSTLLSSSFRRMHSSYNQGREMDVDSITVMET